MELKLAGSCQVPSTAVFGRCSIPASLGKQDFLSNVFYEHVKMSHVSYAFLISKTFRICALSPLNTKYLDWAGGKECTFLLFRASSGMTVAEVMASVDSVCAETSSALGVLWPVVFQGCHAASFLTGLQNNCSVVVMDRMCVSPLKCAC